MSGINETKEVLGFAIALGNAVGKALEDGELGLADLRFVFAPLMKIAPAIEGLEQIPAELKDLTKDEKDELIKYVQDEFEIPQEGVEDAIEGGLAMVSKLYDILVSLGFIK